MTLPFKGSGTHLASTMLSYQLHICKLSGAKCVKTSPVAGTVHAHSLTWLAVTGNGTKSSLVTPVLVLKMSAVRPTNNCDVSGPGLEKLANHEKMRGEGL